MDWGATRRVAERRGYRNLAPCLSGAVDDVDLAGVGPGFRVLNEPGALGIPENVFPFPCVTLVGPENVIEEPALPRARRKRRSSRELSFEATDPLPERSGASYADEEMYVVGHEDIPSHADAMIGRAMRVDAEGLMHGVIREQPGPALGADGHKIKRFRLEDPCQTRRRPRVHGFENRKGEGRVNAEVRAARFFCQSLCSSRPPGDLGAGARKTKCG